VVEEERPNWLVVAEVLLFLNLTGEGSASLR
jgi:hypothetical protein